MQNAFYCFVQRVKRECWQKFLIRNEETEKGNTTKINLKDKNRCWKALQYTKSRISCTTLFFKGPNNEIAVTMQDKEALVKSHVFPKLPAFQGNEYLLR